MSDIKLKSFDPENVKHILRDKEIVTLYFFEPPVGLKGDDMKYCLKQEKGNQVKALLHQASLYYAAADMCEGLAAEIKKNKKIKMDKPMDEVIFVTGPPEELERLANLELLDPQDFTEDDMTDEDRANYLAERAANKPSIFRKE